MPLLGSGFITQVVTGNDVERVIAHGDSKI